MILSYIFKTTPTPTYTEYIDPKTCTWGNGQKSKFSAFWENVQVLPAPYKLDEIVMSLSEGRTLIQSASGIDLLELVMLGRA